MDAGLNVDQSICVRYLLVNVGKFQLYHVRIFVEDDLRFGIKSTFALLYTLHNGDGAPYTASFRSRSGKWMRARYGFDSFTVHSRQLFLIPMFWSWR
jgi:hypothetical protein